MSKVLLILSGVLFFQVSFAGSLIPKTKEKQKRSISQNVEPIYLPKPQADKALQLLIGQSASLELAVSGGCSEKLEKKPFNRVLTAVLKKKSFENKCVFKNDTEATCQLTFDHELTKGDEPSYNAFYYQTKIDSSGNPLQVVSIICKNEA